jgi:erythromycin esterase-like protein
MQVMSVRPSHPQSYEKLCHTTGKTAFILAVGGSSASQQLSEELAKPRLERAIGVVYRPDMELASHYFEAVLPHQFDDYVWFDQTQAVTPLTVRTTPDLPDPYPFGL